MQKLIDILNPALGEVQHQQLIAARKNGKAPHVFFQGAKEMDWLPANAPTSAFGPLSRPLLGEQEMRELTGIPVRKLDLSLLPHDSPDRPVYDHFTAEEISDRYKAALELLSTCNGYILTSHTGAIASFMSKQRGGAFLGMSAQRRDLSPELLQSRRDNLAGEIAYIAGIYLSTEGLNRSPFNQIQTRVRLSDKYICFLPSATADLSLMEQLHELTHARQIVSAKRQLDEEYALERDADENGLAEYIHQGGKPALIFTRLAMRAVPLVCMSTSTKELQYGFTADITGRDVTWDINRAYRASTDLVIRMGNEAAGRPYTPQPEMMYENLTRHLNKLPVQDRKFHEAVSTFNAVIAQDEFFNLRTPGLLEKIWYSNARLHRDTLRVAGMALEGINLFRYGPNAAP